MHKALLIAKASQVARTILVQVNFLATIMRFTKLVVLNFDGLSVCCYHDSKHFIQHNSLRKGQLRINISKVALQLLYPTKGAAQASVKSHLSAVDKETLEQMFRRRRQQSFQEPGFCCRKFKSEFFYSKIKQVTIYEYLNNKNTLNFN